MSQNYNKGAEGHNYYAAASQQTNVPQNIQAMNRNPQQGGYASIPVSVSAHDLKQMPAAANFAMYRSPVPQMQQGYPNHAAAATVLVNPMHQGQRPNYIGQPVQQFYFPQYGPPTFSLRGPSQIYRGATAAQPQQPFVYSQMQQNMFFQQTAALHQRPALQQPTIAPAAPNGLNNIPTELIPAHPPAPQTPTQVPTPTAPTEKKQSKAIAILHPITKENVMENFKKPEKPASNNNEEKLQMQNRNPGEPYVVNQGPNQMGLPPQFPPMVFDGKHYGNFPIWTPPPQQQTPVVSANVDGPSVIPKQQPKKNIKPVHTVPPVTEESPTEITEERHADLPEMEELPQEEVPTNGEEPLLTSADTCDEEITEIVEEQQQESVIEITEQIEELNIVSEMHVQPEPVEEICTTTIDTNTIQEEEEEEEPDHDEEEIQETSIEFLDETNVLAESLENNQKTLDETDKSAGTVHPAASRPEQIRNDFERVMEKYGGQLASNAVLPPGLQKDALGVVSGNLSNVPNKDAEGNTLAESEDDDADKENVSTKPTLKNIIEYHDEQWSPTNPTGKKFYTIEQLLELGKFVAVRQNKTPVKINPSIQNALIPNNQYRVETILQRFNQHRHYQVKRLSQQGNRQMHMNQKMQAMSNQQNQSSNTIKISLSLREEVKLKESANAWKPKHLQNEPSLTDDERVLRELTDSFRCVLNKLTPDNFDVLLEEVKRFEITRSDQLNDCILLVFEKAISEPNYSVTYSLMCKELSGICVHGDSGNQKQHFKNCLINQCQVEFEKAHKIKSAKDCSDLLEKETDPVKREELREKLEEEDYKMRKRAVGTVRFIGELYKIDLLTIRIMHTCVGLLLETRTMNEESLECLCKLLTTVGKKMEGDKKDCLAPYFSKLQEIIGRKSNFKISSRIKFMIQDLIDLRNNRWQPRRNDQNPKTMGQIQKEVEIEQRNIQMMHQYHPGGMGGQMGGPQGRNRYDKRMGGQQMNYKPDKMSFDSTKMDFSRLGNMEAEANLGRATFYQQWNTQGANRYQSGDDSNDVPHRQMPPPGFHHQSSHQHNMGGPQSLPMNMMHPFGNSNKNRDNYRSRGSTERRDYNHHDRYNTSSGNMHSRENSMTKSGSFTRSIGPPGIPMMGQQQQQQQQQQQHQQQNSSASSSRLSYQSSSSGRGSVDSHTGNLYTNSSSNSNKRSNEKPILCEVVNDDERERLKKQFKGIFEDYMGSRELEYAISELQTIKHSQRWAAITEYAFVLFDEHEKERQLLANLCIEYVKNGVATLTIGELLKIFSTLCEIGLDSVLDIPKVGDYLAEYLSPIIKEGILRIHDLLSIGDSWIRNEKGHELLSAVLYQLNNKYEFDVTRDLWCQSGLSWHQFMPHKNTEQLTEFIKNDSLLLALDKAISSNNNGKQQHNWEFIEKSILEYCYREKDENRIKYYIEEWLTKCNTDIDDPNFIRAFTAATIQYCIVKDKTSCYVNEELFTIPKKLLNHYINKDAMREMHALYAIQRVAYSLSYPQNLLHSIFLSLYEQRIISIKGFVSWYYGDDMSNQKGVAKTALRPFIVNISEEQSEHSSSEEEQ